MKKITVSRDEINHLAKLANLQVSEGLAKQLEAELSAILSYVSKLGEVTTSDVDPTFEVTNLSNVTHSGEKTVCLTQAEALSGVSATKDGYFKVKGIFTETDDA